MTFFVKRSWDELFTLGLHPRFSPGLTFGFFHVSILENRTVNILGSSLKSLLETKSLTVITDSIYKTKLNVRDYVREQIPLANLELIRISQ